MNIYWRWELKIANFPLLFLQNDPIKLSFQEYACPICQKIAKTAGDCRKHILTHTGEKPFACTKCNYACKQNSNLHKHMRRVHKIHDYYDF